ncbi:MAG: LicD family protein [[Clostridium] fimetarium]|nr:LicD family protein [Alistipes timonensis]MCM1406003.1 LicD family protein [[Clostridium] fimetarium]
MKELTLRELQLFSLGILKEIHAFCEERGLRYAVAYGTLIGAVRHKGFIPWDDDVDIVMPRPDYERFLREFRSDRLKVAVPGEDSYQPLARVYDTRDTLAFTKYGWKKGERGGVWVDVFPLDAVSDDPVVFDRQAEECRVLFDKVNHLRKRLAKFADLRALSGGWKLWQRWIRVLAKRARVSDEEVMEANRGQLRVMARHLWGSTGHVSQLGARGWVYRDHLPADILDRTALMPFEDTEVRVPADYHTFLIPQYPDYMTIPPEEKRVQHTSSKFFWKNK